MTLSIIDFKSRKQFLDYIGDVEISQDGSLDAYSRLFIHKDGYVSKIYVSRPDLSVKNIENLRRLASLDCMYQLDALTMPMEMLSLEGKIVGYTMPYIQGSILYEALMQSKYSHAQKIDWFNQIGNLICDLPDFVHIGDLHTKNIIISTEGRAKLIDIDGFTVDGGNGMTCPNIFHTIELLPQKYFNSRKDVTIGKNSDIFCLFRIFFNYILQGIDFFLLSTDDRRNCLDYIRALGICEDFILAAETLFADTENIIKKNMFASFTVIDRPILYQDILCKNGSFENGYAPETYLNEYIQKNTNGGIEDGENLLEV